MELNIDCPKSAFIGSTLPVNVSISVDKALKINFSAIRLNVIRPCDKPLVIEQKEIFCEGYFEPDDYKRKINIPLSPKIVPSSSKRGIVYNVELYTRVPETPQPKESKGMQELHEIRNVTLKESKNLNEPLDINPVVLAIKGLKLNLQKDTFKPGETIKINYEAKGLRELKIILMQRSNILCYCTQYGRVCTKVPKIPASAAGMAKTSNPTTGFLLLSIPKNAELSSKHSWEPKEKSTWNDKFGDYNEWFLSINGRKFNGESIQYEIPIDVKQGIQKEKQEDISFFEQKPIQEDNQQAFKEGNLLKVNKIKILDIKKVDDEELGSKVLQIHLQNSLKNSLHGCTCKFSAIKDMFFETQPYMVGFSILEPGQEKIISIPLIHENVTQFNFTFMANEGMLGSFKKSL
ncbi:MAG: hypothetical protein ACTSVI_06175 [Promethearchaeota archaeon]